MPNTPIHRTRLAAALLLALALPFALQAQDGSADPAAAEGDTPESQAVDDASLAEPAADAAAVDEAPPAETSAAPAAADPAVLDAEMMPRASRSLLLDVVRTQAGYFAVGERGHVLSSEDGQAWKQAPVPTRSTLTSIATANGVLWAAGHDGVIVHSTDGGQTWTRRRAAPWTLDTMDPTEGVPVMDVLFVDGMNGFAIGAYSLMLATTDGGVTWEPRSIIDHGDDAAAGGAPTADAGEGEGDDWTFDASDLELDAEADPHLNAIAQDASGALVIAGERGAFFRSRDGGQTWERKRLPYEGSMFGILAWDAGHLLAFGLRGNVLESMDLGDTWTPVDTGVGTSLLGGHALPNGGAILVGANGVVLTRPGTGTPFAATSFKMASGETPNLTGVLPAGDAGFIVVGDKGAGLYRPQ